MCEEARVRDRRSVGGCRRLAVSRQRRTRHLQSKGLRLAFQSVSCSPQPLNTRCPRPRPRYAHLCGAVPWPRRTRSPDARATRSRAMTTIHRIHPAPPMRGRFHLDVCHEDPGEVVIYVVGELDIATTPVLRGSLSDLLERRRPLVDSGGRPVRSTVRRRQRRRTPSQCPPPRRGTRHHAVSHALQRAARPAPAPRPCRGTDRSDPRSR